MRNVVVLGKGELAVKVANWFLHSEEYKILAIVPVMPEPTWTESLATWGRVHGVEMVETGHYKDISHSGADNEHIDLAVSVFYDKIIKASFIDKCRRIINIHNSPLPKYRGVSPINWALKNEEHEHGVTIHEITPGIDDGPIIAQLKYSIYPDFDEVIDVYRRSLEYAWVLFRQTIPLLDKIIVRQQDDARATYYSRKEDVHLEDRSGLVRPKVSLARDGQ